MKNRIKVIGDLHLRKEQPFKKGAINVLDQLIDDAKSYDTILFLGDFFHSSKPFPGDYSVAQEKLYELSTKVFQIVILAGNNAHEYHYVQKTYAIDPLESISKNIKLVKDPELFEVDYLNFLLLPWMPEERIKNYSKGQCSNLNELVNLEAKKIQENDISLDYICYHFEDETVFMGGESHGIDLSIFDNKRIIKRLGGHIHLQNNNYVGTPYQTRYDEIGQKPEFYQIDIDGIKTYEGEHSFNLVFEYKDIDYKENIDLDKEYVLTIKNAPSIEAAINKFKSPKLYIRNIEVTSNEVRDLTESSEDTNKNIKEYLVDYSKINNVDAKTKNYLLNLF